MSSWSKQKSNRAPFWSISYEGEELVHLAPVLLRLLPWPLPAVKRSDSHSLDSTQSAEKSFAQPSPDSSETDPWSVLGPILEKLAYRYGLQSLGRQARSQSQLEQLFKQRGLDAKWCRKALDKLKADGYLDDDSMAKRLEERYVTQSRSARQIKQLLKAKGLALSSQTEAESSSDADFEETEFFEPDSGESQTLKVGSPEQEEEAAFYWLQRWAKRESLLDRPQRYYQRLAQRGFAIATIQRAWKRWLSLKE